MKHIPEKVGGVPVLFILTVLVPTTLAIIYFALCSDIYTSESRFVVQNASKPQVSGLGALIKSSGFNNASEQSFVANDYIVSRDALSTLNRDGLIVKAFGDPEVSFVSRFNPFGSRGSAEHLFKYYLDKVVVKHDPMSGITTLEVKAFDPMDAQRINRRLLEQAEALVNRMNERGREDLVSLTDVELNEAKKTARNAALALSRFRNVEGLVDPEQQAAVQLQMVSKLQDELIAAKTQLVLLRTLTPQNPQIPVYQTRIKELDREIGTQMGQVAGDRKSLAASTVEFQRLQLESQLADKELAAAMSSVQDAKNEARRKRAYVERIVQPNLPDSQSEPKRLRGVLNVFVVGMILWAIMSMIVAGIKEHSD